MTELVYARTESVDSLFKALALATTDFAKTREGGITYIEIVMACDLMLRVISLELGGLKK